MRFAKHQFLGASAVLACALFCCATTASAGVLVDFPGALLSGSTPYQGYHDPPFNTKLSDLKGTIDYAVFLPGTFPTGFEGYTPTPGEFVYAFQAHQTGIAPLSGLSVTLWEHPGVADNIGTFSGLGVEGVVPKIIEGSYGYFFPPSAPTSANWDFDPTVAIGISTSGLVFSSPYGPISSSGSVVDDGTFGVVIPLPSPAPEPSTLIFWTCGIVFGAVRWLRGRKTGS